jgi:hypothetical protein
MASPGKADSPAVSSTPATFEATCWCPSATSWPCVWDARNGALADFIIYGLPSGNLTSKNGI